MKAVLNTKRFDKATRSFGDKWALTALRDEVFRILKTVLRKHAVEISPRKMYLVDGGIWTGKAVIAALKKSKAKR